MPEWVRDADLITTVVPVLHLAADHDAAGLHASVGMVRKASCGLARRHPELIQHEEGVKIPQCTCSQCAADPDPCLLHHFLSLYHLKPGQTVITCSLPTCMLALERLLMIAKAFQKIMMVLQMHGSAIRSGATAHYASRIPWKTDDKRLLTVGKQTHCTRAK